MSLPGRIGPYEIVTRVGAGGMGEVYRARDTRLGRTVAIKVISANLSASSQLRARFEREARAISSLTHPNICALYDVGREGDVDYLVMEYLEGETLSGRIARGPLPLSQLVRYGAEIAQALHHAHRRGIVHRDLKPGNVMITASGAKLLDFGISKSIEPEVQSADPDVRTDLVSMTAEGAIVGTFQYMAPEQLEGKAVDHRADIFALGVILYEMATGRRPFPGSTSAGVIAAILSSEPAPVTAIQAASPAALDHLIRTALEKDPDERWQSAQDVARQLRWIAESSQTADAAAPPRRRRRSLAGLAAIVITAATAAGVISWRAASRSGNAPGVMLEFVPPPNLEIVKIVTAGESNAFALSPDGRTIAFVATRGGGVLGLYLRRLDSSEIRSVEGSEGAGAPFWSSDGRWIGFSARQKLLKVRVSGSEPPETICDLAANHAGASWRGDTILFAERPGGRSGIYRVSANGGNAVPVAGLHGESKKWRLGWPFLLPDGKHFLYQSFSTEPEERRLILAPLDGSRNTMLMRNVSRAMTVGDDELAYVLDGKLLLQRFDVERARMTGEPRTIADDISYFFPTGAAAFDISAAGVVVLQRNTTTGRLLSVDRRGNERVIDDQGPFYDVALSPDGTRAAVAVMARRTGLCDLWIYDLSNSLRDRFTSDSGTEVKPLWSPDGRTIVYSAGGFVPPYLVRRQISKSASEVLTPGGEVFDMAGSFSPDGKTLYFERRSTGRSRHDLMRMTNLESRAVEPVVNTQFDEASPRISPDGQRLAYSSDLTGRHEIYVQNLVTGDRVRVSSSGGLAPRWRDDGQELFYTSLSSVFSVTPRARDDWRSAKATELFRVRSTISSFDVAPNGQSFLIAEWTPGPADRTLVVDSAWRARLGER